MIKISNKNLPKIGEFKYYDLPIIKNEFLVWNDNGELRIYSSFCPHFGGQLLIKHDQLYCPIHGYIYDKDTGKCTNRDIGTGCKKIDYFEDDEGITLDSE